MMQMTRQLDHGRGDVEQQEIEHHVDALGAALDDLGQRAGAPLEMEAQRQSVDVAEHGVGEPARGVLADPLEDGVAQSVEQHAAEAGAGISDDQADGERRRPRPSRPPCGRSRRL